VTTGEPESESEEECTTEEETEAPESSDAVVEIFPLTDSMMAADLQAWTYAHCTEVGVDPYIVMAVCERESCCIANIMGDGGRAYGMMQIHTVWVRDKMAAHGYSDADMLMAEPNITIGVEILQGYIEQGHGIEWALMAYNGGPSMAGTPATQEYARWVIARADELRQ
jgi:soluble lytic murein transglycosylase-like protein